MIMIMISPLFWANSIASGILPLFSPNSQPLSFAFHETPYSLVPGDSKIITISADCTDSHNEYIFCPVENENCEIINGSGCVSLSLQNAVTPIPSIS